MQSYRNGLERQSHRFEFITPSRAEEMLECADLEYQRKLRPAHVKHLAAMMEDGYFLTGWVSEAHVGAPDSIGTRLANGMHTLRAIALSQFGVWCFVELWLCPDEDAFNSLFLSYDTENRKRSYLDCARAIIMSGRVAADTDPRMLSLFQSAATMVRGIGRQGRRSGMTMEGQYDAALERTEELPWLSSLHEDATEKEYTMMRLAVIAAMLCGFRRDYHMATMFWSNVTSGLNTVGYEGELQPAAKLRAKLLRWALYTKGAKGDKEQLTQPEMLAGCLRAWDAFMDGRTIDKLQTVVKTKTGQAWLKKMCAA